MGVGWKDGGWKGLVDASTTQQVVSKRKNSSEAASIYIYRLSKIFGTRYVARKNLGRRPLRVYSPYGRYRQIRRAEVIANLDAIVAKKCLISSMLLL